MTRCLCGCGKLIRTNHQQYFSPACAAKGRRQRCAERVAPVVTPPKQTLAVPMRILVERW